MKLLHYLISAIVILVAGTCQQNVTAEQPTAPVAANRLQTMLIRNTLAAVNQGIITGNFTVLRDLSTDRFRAANKADDLGVMFAPLRQQKLDLSPTLIADPQLTKVEGGADALKLSGYFPTRPRQVEFDLGYTRLERRWMIDQIAIHIGPSTAVTEQEAGTH